MRVLIVKTSSLGDIAHTFPAVTDAARVRPGISFDWVAEESFATLPGLHPAIERVIPCAMRRWRRPWMMTRTFGEWRRFTHETRRHSYDAVIDAQGLLKSALMTRQARGLKHGLDSASSREPLAAWFYDKRYSIAKQRHAITRTRELFACALGYDWTTLPLDYGITAAGESSVAADSVMFLHGASWRSKQWPLDFWRELATNLNAQGKTILVPAAGAAERRFAERLAAPGPARVQVLPPLPLAELIPFVAACQAVVAVDTGLAHLAAALDIPAVVLYGATSARRTGALGNRMNARVRAIQADYACSPCFKRRCDKVPGGGVPPCVHTVSARAVTAAVAGQINQTN